MLYSSFSGGFYDKNVNTEIPADAVEVSDEAYRQLFEGQEAGKIIAPGLDGIPILLDQPQLTGEQLADQATSHRDQLLREAAIRIAPLQDAADLDKATASEEVLLKTWKLYRIDLNRIDQQSGYPADIDWPKKP